MEQGLYWTGSRFLAALCIFLPQKALKVIVMPTPQGLVFIKCMGLGLLSLALHTGSPGPCTEIFLQRKVQKNTLKITFPF